jgi:hypothetical protein
MAQVCCRRGLLDRIAMRGARTKINVSRQQGLKGQPVSGLTVMTIETPQIMKVMTVFPSSPTLLPQGEKGGS